MLACVVSLQPVAAPWPPGLGMEARAQEFSAGEEDGGSEMGAPILAASAQPRFRCAAPFCSTFILLTSSLLSLWLQK